nr:phospholipase-like protein [Tanacetum cinerariifolium]
MSTLLELSSIGKSNYLKDMMVFLFERENEIDLITTNNMNIIAEYLATRVRERDLLIGELDNCLGSTTAYEISKLLREKNDSDLAKASWLHLSYFDHQAHMIDYILQKQCRVNDSHYDMSLTYYVNGCGLHFGRREFSLITGFRFGAVSFSCYSKGDMKFRDRVFPHRVCLTITSLDLLGVIEDEEHFSKLCDADAIRVCILLCLEVIFMGRLLVTGVDDTLMRLVDSLESWNAFPWGIVMLHDSNPIFDLRLTLAEYKSEWWTSTNDFLQVYVPRTPRENLIFSMRISKSLKDSIKELISRIFKLEAIIQVLGRERNGDVVEKLQFSDDFCHVRVEFRNELNQVFLELFESSIIDIVGTTLDADTQEAFDE